MTVPPLTDADLDIARAAARGMFARWGVLPTHAPARFEHTVQSVVCGMMLERHLGALNGLDATELATELPALFPEREGGS